MSRTHLILLLPLVCCAADGDGGSIFDTAGGATDTASTGPGPGPGSSGASGTSGDTSGGGDPSGDATSDGGTGAKFDVGDSGADPTITGGDGDIGCEKVDFLFVVDNSSSMLAHQQALTASFPGFIDSIEARLDTNDFHIMVVDSDTQADPGDGCGECYDRCVLGQNKDCGWEGGEPGFCNGMACGSISPEAPDGCDWLLGAGVVDDQWDQPCDLATGDRYLLGSQPDLKQKFECIATAGTSGTGKELPMGAMVEAVSMTGAGACNAGFIRDDAILVVTVLSDALYAGEANNDPQPWYDTLVAAKGGNPDAIVFMALLRNEPTVVPGPGCQIGAGMCGGGGWSDCNTQYDELVGLFGDQGFMHSICIDDYEPFFSSALDTIEVTCDDFVPEG